ncbi:MAG: nuclear transport factor 2 family protein [Candidatus Pseudobacter hemicellulosilyticus]|uniref:Nuclear transport factor 2 family protein n=1 Tax=Candidatus Pseudobacter hemicellulosilyticus TaxID=3121375 RepID=A0AAJ5X1E3_9BACT|nr:MAG: nuclear transport factor 2 family protein [Pseudobacter sp.]
MEAKQIIRQIIALFDNNDTEGLINIVTDDFEWIMVGDMTVKGKEELKKMFAASGDMEMLSATKDHLVVEGNTGVCDGIVTMKENGEEKERHYCDIYELQGEKLKKMTTYIVNKR